MNRILPVLLALLAAGAQAQAGAQGLYERCQTRGTSDDACHRQIAQAGGAVASSTYRAAAVAARDFFGRNEYGLWYQDYVSRCRHRHERPRLLYDAVQYYPNDPPYNGYLNSGDD